MKECQSTTDPAGHVGPIISDAFSGLRHWMCSACAGTVDPPPRSLATALKVLREAFEKDDYYIENGNNLSEAIEEVLKAGEEWTERA